MNKETIKTLRDKVRKLRLEVLNRYVLSAQSKYILIEMIENGTPKKPIAEGDVVTYFDPKEAGRKKAQEVIKQLSKFEKLRFSKLPTTKKDLLKEIKVLETELELWDSVQVGSSWSLPLERVIGVVIHRWIIFSDLRDFYYGFKKRLS